MGVSLSQSEFYSKSVLEVFKLLDSNKNGLSEKEANLRIKKFGLNQIKSKEGRKPLLIFISQIKNWLVIVLIVASLISFYLGGKVDSVVILVIVFLSVLFGFFQEYKAEKTIDKLRKFISFQAKVLRDGSWVQLDAKLLCAGDLIKLRIGDRVPADLRLIESDELSLDESILTGESLPKVKSLKEISGSNIPPQKQDNMAFAGTHVSSGIGLGIICFTGNETYIGQTAKSLQSESPPTDFQKNIKEFSKFLFKIITVLTIFVFGANAFLGKGILDSFLFAVALAVGITPELLPIIITVTLSQGAVRMAKDKVVVKKLASVEDFGNIDTLCADKTGTLTEGKFKLTKFLDLNFKENRNVLLLGLICTSNFAQGKSLASNELDKALWETDFTKGFKDVLGKYQLLDENEFDFERRRASVLVEHEGKRLLITKGASESVLAVCKNVDKGVKMKISKLEEQGERVILVASKILQKQTSNSKDEKDLQLEGILQFSDPVKNDAKSSLAIFQRLGVRIKILSGDSPKVVSKVAWEVGLLDKSTKIVTGEELSGLSESQLEMYAEKYYLFARISPDQKEKIVASLNKEGHVVGFLGDGVNDAQALKAADVGIAVDSGADIAKEASDIVLLEKNLAVLGQGIEAGRKTFGNITKYILNTVSANYGNMFTVAISSLFLPFIPLLPSQILLNNFISDVPLLALASDNVDSNFIKRPRRWNINMIGKFMISFGLISSFFDFATILPLLLIWKIGPAGFRTGWFIESAISEMVVTFAIRTRLPFYKSKPSRLLLTLSILSIISVVLFPLTNFGKYFFNFVTIPVSSFIWIGIVLTLYFITVEIVKGYFFKKVEDEN